MSNAKRPALQRQHTRTTKAKRADALDQGVRVCIGDDVYEVRVGDVTPGIARELRTQTGMGFMRLVNMLSVDPDIDLVSAFVWVARRVRGESVDLDDVNVDYRTLVDDFEYEVIAGPEEVDPSDPEG